MAAPPGQVYQVFRLTLGPYRDPNNDLLGFGTSAPSWRLHESVSNHLLRGYTWIPIGKGWRMENGGEVDGFTWVEKQPNEGGAFGEDRTYLEGFV